MSTTLIITDNIRANPIIKLIRLYYNIKIRDDIFYINKKIIKQRAAENNPHPFNLALISSAATQKSGDDNKTQ